MPTYPYRCTACEHRFDAFQKMSDARLVTCPQCQKDSLERLVYGGTPPIWKGGVAGEKGLEYKEKSRAELAASKPEAFDRVLEKERAEAKPAKAPKRPPADQ